METVKRVGLDTNIFMAVFLDEKERADPSLRILSLISDGALEGVICSVLLIEIATLFYQEKEKQKGINAVELIRGIPNITIVDITSDMVLSIADTKVAEKLSIADATILSSTLELGADVFLTYDSDFAKVKKIRCMKPEDYLKSLSDQIAENA